MKHIVLAASCLSFSSWSTAQKTLDLRADGDPTTVILRGYAHEDALQPALQAFWRFAPDTPVSFSYQRLSAPATERALALRQLLIAGIEQYLDDRLHFEKGGVRSAVSDEQLLREMNAMAASAAREFEVDEAFSGFTEPTMEQLERITHIDWSQATFNSGGGDEQDKYLAIYFYVRSQRQELQRQLRADLMPLAAVDILRPVEQENAFETGRGVEVPTVCSTVYDDQNYLCALDLAVEGTTLGVTDSQLTDELMMKLAQKARETAAEVPAEEMPISNHKVRKRDRWLKAELDRINERIEELDQRKELWRLRDRMDDIESRLDDIGMEVQELKEDAPLATDNPLANLSDLTGLNVIVRFPRNSSELDAEYRVILNEVFEQLARSPEDRVLITGYTDRSGDPVVNLALSESRAKAVRNYLLSRGIASDRLMVNFYGDSRSDGRNPEERRVEVEWLR